MYDALEVVNVSQGILGAQTRPESDQRGELVGLTGRIVSAGMNKLVTVQTGSTAVPLIGLGVEHAVAEANTEVVEVIGAPDI